MQRLFIHSGADAKETTLLLNDTHMFKQFVLEDVNNLLNTGDIPNLFKNEDFLPLIDKLRSRAKK